MDMSLAEQLVWAAVYAQEWCKETTKPHTRARRCANKASQVVVGMRSLANTASSHAPTRQAMGKQSFDHLCQMTFKAKD